MNETDIKQESAKAVSRNMVGMSDKDVLEYVSGRRSFSCLVASICFSVLAGILAVWMVWAVCRGEPAALSKAPCSVCPLCGRNEE